MKEKNFHTNANLEADFNDKLLNYNNIQNPKLHGKIQFKNVSFNYSTKIKLLF